MLSPEMLHLVFAVGGALLGWYLRHRQGGLAPEILDLLKEFEAHQSSQRKAALRAALTKPVDHPSPAV